MRSVSLWHLLPDRDVAHAVVREGCTSPTSPPLAQTHTRDPRHQVELRCPDVPERHGEDPSPAIHDPVVMRNPELGSDVQLVDAEMGRAHGEGAEPLTRREPL